MKKTKERSGKTSKRLSIVISGRFRKDLRHEKRRGRNLSRLEAVVEKLASGKPLDISNHDHNLSGNLSGFRECHIEPDWLLIYRVEEDDLILLLMRTGTHSDLF